MLEVCFGDSVKGALRCAQHCGGSIGGAVGIAVIGEGKLSKAAYRRELARVQAEREELERHAISLGGGSQDLVGISCMLQAGDIAASLTAGDCVRRRLVHDVFSADPWGELEQMERETERFWRGLMGDLNRLQTRAAGGEPVRIWADSTPDAACGLLFAAQLLAELDTAVSLVPLPPVHLRPNGTVVRHSGWGEVAPEEFGRFLPQERTVPRQVLDAYAQQWRRLQEENAPLRAVVNGRVVSVQENFYDGFIRQQFPEGECRVAQLIGRVLGSYQLGIGDWLVAQRVRRMLDCGELALVQEDPGRFYNSVIRKGEEKR